MIHVVPKANEGASEVQKCRGGELVMMRRHQTDVARLLTSGYDLASHAFKMARRISTGHSAYECEDKYAPIVFHNVSLS